MCVCVCVCVASNTTAAEFLKIGFGVDDWLAGWLAGVEAVRHTFSHFGPRSRDTNVKKVHRSCSDTLSLFFQ